MLLLGISLAALALAYWWDFFRNDDLGYWVYSGSVALLILILVILMYT